MEPPSDHAEQFTELTKQYAGPIRRLCRLYAPAHSDRDDLFQEIFLAVWRALPSFRSESSVRTWLYRIAHNVALTWQLRDRRKRGREDQLDDAIKHPASELDVRRLDLDRAVASLNPADRMLTLLWLEGLSAAEIEEVTGVRAGTVAVRLSRIRKRLGPPEDALD